ncbi:PAS domain-containing protein [Phormidium tenue FACHB-886]|nr:PAS domain-containing protein [Phormidium tenue FACHB-886]
MPEAVSGLFNTSFIPHGHCYLWKPGLVGLHIASDLLIALAYYSIPLTLFYLVKQRRDLPFNWIFLLFCGFIVACGTTHLMEVWTLWHPVYWLSGALKAATASISVFTAAQMVPLVPKALALPSSAQLQEANQALQTQISERLKVEAELKHYQTQLEQLVADRTNQLEVSNQQMRSLLIREQQALAEAEAIYASAPIGLCVLDREFRYVRINDYLAEINGISAAEHIGRTVREVLPDLGAVQERIFQQVVETGEPILKQEVHGTLPAQPEIERDWLVSYYPLKDEAGEVQGINVTAQEITDRKRAEQVLADRATELADLNLILAQTMTTLKERNQELDQFAYVVSHDLKAPLRAITSLSEWIEDDLEGQLPPENQQQLQLLRNRVQRMESLINGLLDYSRIGRREIETSSFSVQQLLEETVDSLSPPPSFTIVIDPMPMLTGKRLLLSQVFSNLIGNAIKHHDRLDGKVRVSVQDQGDFYAFSVADDGAGIERQYFDRIFTIFQTLKARDEQENTGIGLSIVKKIVETEGGFIQVESEVGQGTTFRFTWLKQPKQSSSR